MTKETTAQPDHIVMHGAALAGAVFVLAMANFMSVLDTTIVNVAVPHIAGALAVSPNEGTWVITSYAVAEAITVPLSGWLAARFGAVRVFLSAFGASRAEAQDIELRIRQQQADVRFRQEQVRQRLERVNGVNRVVYDISSKPPNSAIQYRSRKPRFPSL